MPQISIITPAFKASATLKDAVKSVLVQDFADWEMLVVSDDGADYAALLDGAGIADPRIRHLNTGGTGTGSSHARNVGLDAALGDFIAILDADDRMLPGKLTQFGQALERHPLVSTALSVTDATGRALRMVAAGPDRRIAAGDYKFVNFSMDSMIGYDRRAGDPRCDRDLECLTDLDLILRLFATRTHCYHLGTPLHEYRKQPVSISNGPGAGARFTRTKQALIAALEAGRYPMRAAGAKEGFIRFLEISLAAERAYGQALETDPAHLFEDQIEPLLSAFSTSSA